MNVFQTASYSHGRNRIDFGWLDLLRPAHSPKGPCYANYIPELTVVN